MEAQEDEKVIVQSLIGGSQLPFYLRCLKSLNKFCQDRIDLLLHSDGPLSKEDNDLIHSELDGANVNIQEYYQNTNHVLDCLQGRPNCQKFRKDSIWGIEFFDPIFAFPDDSISFYLDADILFLRPFSGLFDRNQVRNGAIFHKDTQWDAYSFRPWHLLGSGKKLQIVKGITTSLVFWDKTVIDWDYLEWFLGQVKYHKIPEWVLPTAQSGLAAQCDAKTIASSQLVNMYPNAKIEDDSFGLHLLGSYRQNWLQKLKEFKTSENLSRKPIEPKFENCRLQTSIGYGTKQVKRWINTRLNRW